MKKKNIHSVWHHKYPKVRNIIKQSKSDKIEIGYKFGLEFTTLSMEEILYQN